MTYEKGVFAQADPGIVSGSTIERKQMSTKTIYKRIALVAVTALGAGVLSVAPASATVAATATSVANAGATIGVGVTFASTISATSAAADTGTIALALVAPSGSGVTLAKRDGVNSTAVWANTGAAGGCACTPTYSAPNISWTATAFTDAVIGTVTIIPDVAGTYTLTISGASSSSRTITIVAGAAPTFAGGTGYTVTSPSAITQSVGGIATYNVVSDATNTSYQIAASGQTILSAFTTTTAQYLLTSAGAATALLTTGTTGLTYANGTTAQGGFTFTPGSNKGTAYVQIQVQSTVAGAGTLTVTPLNASGVPGTAVTSTTTWGAAPTIGVAGTSSVSLIDASTGTPFAGAAADVVITAPSTAGTRQATIKLTLKDTQAVPAIIAAKAVTATVTGPGLIGASVGTATDNAYTDATVSNTRGRAMTANTDSLGNVYFGVYGDGTSGVSTITLTQGTTVVGIEKVTFYGALASFKATVKRNIAASSAATTAALDVIAYDANNVVVPTVGITVTSGTTATIASFTETTSAAADVVAGTAVVDVTGITGKFGPVVLTIKDTATGLISTTATVNVGATEAKTVTAAFDKATYTPGELVTLTISALDANGVAVGDTASVATAYSILTNAAVQGTLPTAAEFKLGKQAITFYAPLVSGPLKAEITLLTGAAHAAALVGTKVTASATVGANTDISAITTLINSLIAKINALNKLVIKIQKKVRA
jgi:trimeric autotransporter adhesin